MNIDKVAKNLVLESDTELCEESVQQAKEFLLAEVKDAYMIRRKADGTFETDDLECVGFEMKHTAANIKEALAWIMVSEADKGLLDLE